MVGYLESNASQATMFGGMLLKLAEAYTSLKRIEVFKSSNLIIMYFYLYKE